MNGPDHYRQAEQYVTELDAGMHNGADLEGLTVCALSAIAHGVLALTSAVIDTAPDHPVINDVAWDAARGRTDR